MCVTLEDTLSSVALSKRANARAVAATVGLFLVAVLTMASFGGYAQEKAKGQIAAASRGIGSIAFTLTESDCPPRGMKRPCYGRSNIWRVNSDGSGEQPLTRINAFQCGSGEPAWSPDGNHIAFSSTCARQEVPPNALYSEVVTASNIWIMKADGSEPRRLTGFFEPVAVGARGAVWSPNGRKLAFMSNALLDGEEPELKGNGSNVWVMNADGTGASPLTRITRDDIGAGAVQTGSIVWSPDGRKLAFVSNRALDGSNAQNTNEIKNVWVTNADGSGLMPLTKLTAANTYVSAPVVWSPDSRKLAFSWHRALDNTVAVEPVSLSNIWVANADGSDLKSLTRITDESASASWPDWSPDGSKLIFASKDNIWVMNADGSGTKPLTDLRARFTPAVSSPVWSPDGTRIAFQYTDYVEPTDNIRRTTSNVWVINADGSGAAPVTHWHSGGVSGRLACITGRANFQPVTQSTRRKRQQISARPRD
jgi:Tol biopolymer transport system component